MRRIAPRARYRHSHAAGACLRGRSAVVWRSSRAAACGGVRARATRRRRAPDYAPGARRRPAAAGAALRPRPIAPARAARRVRARLPRSAAIRRWSTSLGVLVRAVPDRVALVPAGVGQARRRRSPSSASTRRTRRRRQDLPRRAPGPVPELTDPDQEIDDAYRARRGYPGDRLLRLRAASASTSSRASTPSRPTLAADIGATRGSASVSARRAEAARSDNWGMGARGSGSGSARRSPSPAPRWIAPAARPPASSGTRADRLLDPAPGDDRPGDREVDLARPRRRRRRGREAGDHPPRHARRPRDSMRSIVEDMGSRADAGGRLRVPEQRPRRLGRRLHHRGRATSPRWHRRPTSARRRRSDRTGGDSGGTLGAQDQERRRRVRCARWPRSHGRDGEARPARWSPRRRTSPPTRR